MRIDRGTENGLPESNRAFHRHLGRLGFTQAYEEHPGGHDWAYWEKHRQTAVKFLAAALRIGVI